MRTSKELTISLKVIYEGNQMTIKTHPQEYRSLMHLLSDKLFTEGFGDCSGMGKCGTCKIEIISSKFRLTDFGRNELVTMKRNGEEPITTRLACQILADENIDGLEINII